MTSAETSQIMFSLKKKPQEFYQPTAMLNQRFQFFVVITYNRDNGHNINYWIWNKVLFLYFQNTQKPTEKLKIHFLRSQFLLLQCMILWNVILFTFKLKVINADLIRSVWITFHFPETSMVSATVLPRILLLETKINWNEMKILPQRLDHFNRLWIKLSSSQLAYCVIFIKIPRKIRQLYCVRKFEVIL